MLQPTFNGWLVIGELHCRSRLWHWSRKFYNTGKLIKQPQMLSTSTKRRVLRKLYTNLGKFVSTQLTQKFAQVEWYFLPFTPTTFSMTTLVVSFENDVRLSRQTAHDVADVAFETRQRLKSKTARLGMTSERDLRLTIMTFHDFSVSSHNDCTASFQTAIE